MTPNQLNGAWFEVTDENDDPKSGLTIADFNITARVMATGASTTSAWPHSASVLEEPGEPGTYFFTFMSAPAGPRWRFRARPVNPLFAINPGYYTDDQQKLDLDLVYSLLARAVVADPVSHLIGSVVPRSKGAYFYDEWNIPFKLGGIPLPLDGFTDLRLRVNSQDKTTRVLVAANNVDGFQISGSADGILRIVWPESTGSGPADIYAHLPPNASTAPPLLWQVDGLFGGLTGHRVPIVRSSNLSLFRSEKV